VDHTADRPDRPALRWTGAGKNTLPLLLLLLLLPPATLRAGMLLLLMTLMLLLREMPKQKRNVATSSTTVLLPTARTALLLSRLNRLALALGARRPCFLELVRSLLHLLLPSVLLLLPALLLLPVVLLVLALVVLLAAAAAGATCRAGWLRLVAPELRGLAQGVGALSAAGVFCAEPAEMLLLLKPLLLLLLLLLLLITTLKVFSIADSK
jgi:hypothetical protein